METYTIRRQGDGWHVTDGRQTLGPFASEEAATEEAFKRADQASLDGERSAVRIEDDDERCRVLHRYGPR